jgi:hypothetical protein
MDAASALLCGEIVKIFEIWGVVSGEIAATFKQFVICNLEKRIRVKLVERILSEEQRSI